MVNAQILGRGDRWDLMVLVPMGGDASAYFAAPRVARREAAGRVLLESASRR